MNISEAKALFTKYNNGTCTDEETELLEAFLDSYQKKNKVATPSNFENVELSKEKIWESILKEIQQVKKEKKYPFKRYLLYPAAAAILVLIGLTFFFQNKDTFFPKASIVNSDIQTGTDKATLTLSTGTTVTLEKGNIYNNGNIKSDGESLVYNEEPEQLDSNIPYNFLTIPRGGQFFVQLSDGTKVWLNSESKLKYPVNFVDGKPRVVELVYGEAYFEVSPSTKHNGSNFQVNSKDQNIEVLGTQFNVKAYPDDISTYTTLVEGKIELQTKSQSELLSPNQQAIVRNGLENIIVNQVDVYNEISWKDGIFSFKGKTLKDLMRVLSRWYDVEVVFENKSLEEMKFKGVLGKDQSIDEILSAIKSASVINSYEIKKNTIILR